MRPIAVWNTARDAWEKPDSEGLHCEHLDVFSETFPTSGMTASGAAYALPTWEPATDDSGYSSLPKGARVFSTPDLMPEAPNAGTNSVRTMGLGNQVKELMLPTPTVSDTNGAGKHGDGGLDLRTAVSLLLPTPMTAYTSRNAETFLDQRPAGNGQRRTVISDLRIVVEEVLPDGAPTSPPSVAGKPQPDGQLPGQLSLLDAMEESA